MYQGILSDPGVLVCTKFSDRVCLCKQYLLCVGHIGCTCAAKLCGAKVGAAADTCCGRPCVVPSASLEAACVESQLTHSAIFVETANHWQQPVLDPSTVLLRERSIDRTCCKAPLIVSCDTNGCRCHGQCQHVVIVVTFVSCETFAPYSQAVLSHAGCLHVRTCAGTTMYFVLLGAGHFSPLVHNPEVGCATLLTVCHLSRFRLFGGAFSLAYSPHCFFVQLVAGL